MSDIDVEQIAFPDFKSECIIADKIYAHCQLRECFEKAVIELPKEGLFEFIEIRFMPGELVLGTLFISPIVNRPNFRRVSFRVLIPFVVKVRNTETNEIIVLSNELPEIHKDLVLFMPKARDEFKFEIKLETASQLLTDVTKEGNSLVCAIGVFIVVKVVGRVQLLIPVFQFCPEPSECEEFIEDETSFLFDTAPFPELFPSQLEDFRL
ncbi:hypothetical protein F8154_03290 [Alkaliphilus pronyensis]|uniref:DUF3794 domain-containing protein n=1 Tax=Alkaliphilus pronyensis TaxID=1482732 RepID=A0A6I0FE37_9FIRM|nr:hypothetical protein [Alkaliphilus pronyensis]KAB3537329.1 hypothetical protein F8154_03290 [Alkaliphilus pronyensis]